MGITLAVMRSEENSELETLRYGISEASTTLGVILQISIPEGTFLNSSGVCFILEDLTVQDLMVFILKCRDMKKGNNTIQMEAQIDNELEAVISKNFILRDRSGDLSLTVTQRSTQDSVI